MLNRQELKLLLKVLENITNRDYFFSKTQNIILDNLQIKLQKWFFNSYKKGGN